MIYRCDYCGRYGAPGSCEGCGAANRPSTQGRGRQFLTVNEARALDDLPPFDPNRWYPPSMLEFFILPTFPKVRR